LASAPVVNTAAIAALRRIPLSLLVASVLYVALGVALPVVLLSWVEGAAFLIVVTCVVPALYRRLF
jgi:hypothetical protein